jgi:hypothetical protein
MKWWNRRLGQDEQVRRPHLSHRPLIIALTKSAAEDYIYSKIHAVMEFTGEHIRSEPPSWPITPFKELCYGRIKESWQQKAFLVSFGSICIHCAVRRSEPFLRHDA